MKSQSKFLFSAFLSGLAVMAAELSGARLLAPFFGNSLFVWTNMLGLIMLALALGYYFGGVFSDKHPQEKKYFQILFMAGAWIALIPIFSSVWMPWMQGLGSLSNIVVMGSFLTVFVIFVFPMILLGMMVPFTLKLLAHSLNDVGKLSGEVSLVSTAGSLLGTFLPAFLLIPSVGVNWSFVLLGGLLMLWSVVQLRAKFLLLTALGVSLFSLLFFSQSNEQWLFSKESPYGHVFVGEQGQRRLLYVDNEFGIQSIYDPSSPIIKEYYSFFSILPPMRPEAKRVLILGHAGGSFTRMFNAFYPDLEVTGVELNPVVTEAAQEVMGLNDLLVDLHHADARSFLLNTDERWDFILVDAYKGSTIPAHLSTREFFELAGSRLSENGILGINLAAKESDFSKSLSNSFVHGFAHALSFPVPQSYNRILLASHASLDLPSLDLGLKSIETWVAAESKTFAYDEDQKIFVDDKSSLVELKNAQMLVDMYSRH